MIIFLITNCYIFLFHIITLDGTSRAVLCSNNKEYPYLNLDFNDSILIFPIKLDDIFWFDKYIYKSIFPILLRNFILFFLFFVATLCGLRDLSSLTRDWTWATAVKVPSPNHWTAREFPRNFILKNFNLSYCLRTITSAINTCWIIPFPLE